MNLEYSEYVILDNRKFKKVSTGVDEFQLTINQSYGDVEFLDELRRRSEPFLIITDTNGIIYQGLCFIQQIEYIKQTGEDLICSIVIQMHPGHIPVRCS